MRALEGKDDEAAAVMLELAEATRQEPGCIHYIPVRDAEDPRTFLFYEQYVDRRRSTSTPRATTSSVSRPGTCSG
jgi:quinol monooxygenase YgiN